MEREPNKAQDLLPKDFFKQFQNKEDFHSFLNDLFKQGVEEMLQVELDEHLGYQKHSKEGHNSGNSRNGSYSKKVKTESLWDMVLNISRDRNTEYSPRIALTIEAISWHANGECRARTKADR